MIDYIEPGKPNQNAYIERFNRTYRDEVLSAYLFESTAQVQRITDDWLIEYNELRPHDSLGRVPPLTYLPRDMPAGESSFKLSTGRGSLRRKLRLPPTRRNVLGRLSQPRHALVSYCTSRTHS